MHISSPSESKVAYECWGALGTCRARGPRQLVPHYEAGQWILERLSHRAPAGRELLPGVTMLRRGNRLFIGTPEGADEKLAS